MDTNILKKILNTNNLMAQENGTPMALQMAYNSYYEPFILEKMMSDIGMSKTRWAKELKPSKEKLMKELQAEV